MKSIKTPNHPAYHWSTLWPLEVWVLGLYKPWWFCIHKLSMFISINVELTSTFLLYRGLVHQHHWILNMFIYLSIVLPLHKTALSPQYDKSHSALSMHEQKDSSWFKYDTVSYLSFSHGKLYQHSMIPLNVC